MGIKQAMNDVAIPFQPAFPRRLGSQKIPFVVEEKFALVYVIMKPFLAFEVDLAAVLYVLSTL